MAEPALLRAEGLAKWFPPASRGSEGVLALDGVDLELRPGEFVSVIGPSGCGKSTLLNLLAGLDPPSRGRVLLRGQQAGSPLGEVGYMPQADLLLPWRSVVDNAALPLELAGLPRHKARERARAELPRFGLAGFERARPAQLSGGMRQRVALLRTFLSGREVMLLDEPFAALDALTRQAMQRHLLELWERDRKAVLFVTHDVREALFLSDRVYVMSARPGRIELEVEVGLPRPRELGSALAHPRFAELERALLGRLQGAVDGRTP